MRGLTSESKGFVRILSGAIQHTTIAHLGKARVGDGSNRTHSNTSRGVAAGNERCESVRLKAVAWSHTHAPRTPLQTTGSTFTAERLGSGLFGSKRSLGQ